MKKQILILLILLSSFFLYSQELNQENLVYKEDFSSSKIETLKFNLTFENLITKTFYGDEITIEIYCNNSIKTPEIKFNEISLNISSTKQKATIGDVCTIVVYLPKKHTFESVNISNNTGSISLDSLNAFDYIKIFNKKGNVNILNSNTSYLNIKTQTGNINVKDQVLDYFQTESDSGETTVSLIDTPFAKSQAKSNSGNITLKLPLFSDYNLEVKSKSGTFWDFEKGTSEKIKRTLYKKINSGGVVIYAETKTGNIYLQSQ